MALDIIDSRGSDHLDHSEYLHDMGKWARMPGGIEEVSPYRESMGGGEAYTERTYLVPWSNYKVARQWFLGYSTSEIVESEAAVVAAAVAFWGGIPTLIDAALLAKRIAVLRREIPAQDPVHPWLFASDWQVMEGHGAEVQDPDNTATDSQGNVVLDEDGEPLVIPALAYVDNALGGNAIIGELPPGITQNIIDTGFDGGFVSGRFKDGKARVRVRYTPRKYAVMNDAEAESRGGGELCRYVTREEKYSLEVVSLARLAANGSTLPQLRFFEGPAVVPPVTVDLRGKAVPEAGVKQLPGAVLRYTWHDVPDRPMATYAYVLGKVNADPFDGFGGAPTYPAGTLLCQPWETVRKVSPTGRVTWDITYNFMLRPQGWNKFLTAYGDFYGATFSDKPLGDPDGAKVYPTADFSLLFKVPVPVRYR